MKWQEHKDLVNEVLETLEHVGVKIKVSRNKWFKCEVELLGHVVSEIQES